MTLEIGDCESATGAQLQAARLRLFDGRVHELGGVATATRLIRRFDMHDHTHAADVAIVGKREKAIGDEFIAMCGDIVAETHDPGLGSHNSILRPSKSM